MPRVKIKYPVICIDVVEIQVSDKQIKDMKSMTSTEKAEFTKNKLNELGVSNMSALIALEGAFEYGYAKFLYPDNK